MIPAIIIIGIILLFLFNIYSNLLQAAYDRGRLKNNRKQHDRPLTASLHHIKNKIIWL